jgi:hypothetical protein
VYSRCFNFFLSYSISAHYLWRVTNPARRFSACLLYVGMSESSSDVCIRYANSLGEGVRLLAVSRCIDCRATRIQTSASDIDRTKLWQERHSRRGETFAKTDASNVCEGSFRARSTSTGCLPYSVTYFILLNLCINETATISLNSR